MPKGMMLVQSRPASPDREDDFNAWYRDVHLPQIRAIPGFVAARRYRVHGDVLGGDGAVPEYVAVYDIEADDITLPVQELRTRSAAGQMTHSDSLAVTPPPIVTLYELIE